MKPGAHADEVVLGEDSIELRVRAPAREGQANDAARRLLAGALGIGVSRVVLVRGAASRRKAFEVRDLERAQALSLLAERGTATFPSKKPPDGL